MHAIPSHVPLSLAHLSNVHSTPVELLHAAGEAGFSSISIRLAPIIPDDPNYPIDTEDQQAAVRQAIADTGVQLLFMEFLWLSDKPADVDAWRRVLDAGTAVGASRLMVGGMVPEVDVVAERLAQICEIAAGYKVEVDLEPIPAAPIGSVAASAEIIRKSGAANAHLLLDALHFRRGGSKLEDVKAARDLIQVFHLCDAPLDGPTTPEKMGEEASFHRLLPGDGELEIWPLIDLLNDDCLIGVEVPMDTMYPKLSVAQRLTKLSEASRKFLANRR